MTPRPTTHIPITVPPVNATESAFTSEVRAAAVVLTLARVATRIPKKPASPEQLAPTMKETPTRAVPRVQFATASRTATTRTKMASVEYSRRRNAIAPSRM
jgi:hypothetical protein